MGGDGTDRSARWFAGQDVFGFIHRAALRSEGISDEAMRDRPIVGICNAWSELVNCNLHLRGLAETVKRGVWQAGGVPLEFPSLSLSENLTKPTTMLYRNLAAIEIEETIRSSPLDAVVLLAGCDKSVPAALMGAASADVPAIMLTGGPREAGHFRGRRVGAGTDLWHYTEDLRAGRMSEGEYAALEAASSPSVGHCSEMGTASTMAALVEALGMCLPNAATAPAVSARRVSLAERTGRSAVELAREGRCPSAVLTRDAFHNALTVLAALGGSTNAVLHLLALARRAGVALDLAEFDAVAARTPIIVDVQPVGAGLFEDLDRAGGIPAVLSELRNLLRLDALTVTGETLRDRLAGAAVHDRDVVRTIDHPVADRGGLVVLRGSLAPGGALLKAGAMSPRLRAHRGPAVVFENIDDLLARIDDPDLHVDEDSVLVLRNGGPKGAPGMPEWGMLPIPRKLLERGVDDMLRISDARMSGTGYGSVVLHVTPESAVGGPLLAVRTGDEIELDVDARRLELCVPSEEIEARIAATPLPAPRYTRGYGRLHLQHVLQADAGADLEGFERDPREPAGPAEPYGLLQGWISGW
jgi:dihydroxy-acid dehydratase